MTYCIYLYVSRSLRLKMGLSKPKMSSRKENKTKQNKQLKNAETDYLLNSIWLYGNYWCTAKLHYKLEFPKITFKQVFVEAYLLGTHKTGIFVPDEPISAKDPES